MLNRIIKYFINQPLVTTLLSTLVIIWGLLVAPFGWNLGNLPTDPVPVDAIPNIGENQQIVFTEWMGRSPQDIDDQITYPLTTALLGIPGVKSVRSNSIFGASSIYLIFEENIEFYWSRSRILEKLNALPKGLLPEGVTPTLGPDATALGQVFWYTLEGRDSLGNTTGGWDLHEIRKVQDFYVKYGLNAAKDVAEVASIGGYIQEYQVDLDPAALHAYQIPLQKIAAAVRATNQEIGAKTIEINQAEYLVRGLGYVQSISDIESAVVAFRNETPIRIKDIARVSLGPANRRGVLDKEGAEVVGGVVVARYGANPMAVIQGVKEKINELSKGLPKKVLSNGVTSQLTIVPFYDRTQLIQETLGTLEEALRLEILITVLVVVVMILNLRASILVSSLLPISVLMVFIAMRYFQVEANIVALSGIAIAIGTMVDLGIVLSENILKHIDQPSQTHTLKETVYMAAAEVSNAIVTAVATTIVSFIPVFTMEAAEGKLFKPLAFTKTFALIAALLVSLLILPTIARWFLGFKINTKINKNLFYAALLLLGLGTVFTLSTWAGTTLICFSLAYGIKELSPWKHWIIQQLGLIVTVVSIVWLMANYWMPLGVDQSLFFNFIFVVSIVGIILFAFRSLEYFYEHILTICLRYKWWFLTFPLIIIYFGFSIWKDTGKEFMPALNEGSFLLMPSSMPHAGMEQNQRVLQQLDMLVANIPEVETVVGKMGRAATALDPAPIGMYENIINYKPEYQLDDQGRRARFKTNKDGLFVLVSGESIDQKGAIEQGITAKQLIPDKNGVYFRNWRKHIHSPEDIWQEIYQASNLPGVTSAPKLQPIETRLVMLQTGMRAPMGIKVYGADLASIEKFGKALENILKTVPQVKADAVFADRIVGKPYLLLKVNRANISRYGLSVSEVQQNIEIAIGGKPISTTVEGRERFEIRVRYPRSLRDTPAKIAKILVSTPDGRQIPLGDLVDIQYEQGPQMIKSENTFLVGYVLFDKASGYAEGAVVAAAKNAIQAHIQSGDLDIPTGISYKFSGNYENQIRAESRLMVIIPLVLLIIFLILYFQFKSISTALMIFTGIAMAFSGGFIMLWLYDQSWFLNIELFGINFRTLFQIKTINLSVAVWVGFIALFGIATDDGVLMGTYLEQRFKGNAFSTVTEVRLAVIEAAKRRIKPAVMTSATTIIALLPVLTSTGKGSDIMIPMAIPAFGGMIVAAITYFIVPVLYCIRKELVLKK